MAPSADTRIYWVFALFPVAVAVSLAVWAHDFVAEAVGHNPILNLSILLIILGGVGITLAALVAFQREAGWMRQVRRAALAVGDTSSHDTSGGDVVRDVIRAIPAGSRVGEAFRAALDTDSAQDLAERNEVIRRLQDSLQAQLRLPGFLSGFMIALGLFGTFIGLLETLESTGALIANFGTQTTDTTAAVGRLVKGMQGPLGGMATSFSASLFGLLGSLVLSAMLNALQALSHRIVQSVRAVIATVARDPSAGGWPSVLGEGVPALALGLDRLMQQQQQAMDLFLRSREADEAVARTLRQIADGIAAQQRQLDGMIDAQSVLNRALDTQLAQSQQLTEAVIQQTEAVVTIKRSQDLLIRVTEQVATATSDIGRIAGEIEITQRRVLASERRSSEFYAALTTGIERLAERDVSLADMQRAAVDSVRHAAQIGQRLGEASVHFAEIRATLTDAIDTGLARLGEVQATQVAQQTEIVRGLNHLLATLEFKDRDLLSALREQSVSLTGIGRDLAEIVERPADAPFTENVVGRLGDVIADRVSQAQEGLIRRLPLTLSGPPGPVSGPAATSAGDPSSATDPTEGPDRG